MSEKIDKIQIENVGFFEAESAASKNDILELFKDHGHRLHYNFIESRESKDIAHVRHKDAERNRLEVETHGKEKVDFWFQNRDDYERALVYVEKALTSS